MFARSFRLLYVVHSPRGINFSLNADEAIAAVNDKYSKRWFGAQTQYLNLSTPVKEFLPFYFCNGRIAATYTASVSYTDSARDDKGNTSSTSRTVQTAPQQLFSIFEENRTQNYAGYKYNIAHVHSALRSERNPLLLHKLPEVDTAGAAIDLFEQSTMTMKTIVEQEVERQARETAEAQVRSYHPTASSVTILFSELHITIDQVTPVFVPCFVIKAEYDEQTYTIYVSGANGNVGGPYLLNALYIGRTAAAVVGGLVLLTTPNKVAGVFFASVAGAAAYLLAFYAAKYYPRYRRDHLHRKRAALRNERLGQDNAGFRPSAKSQRITEEYRQSSYWDTHAYQRRQSSQGFRGRWSSSASSSSSSSQASSTEGGAGGGGQAQAGRQHIIRDPKGYYKALQLNGDESINEIRSSYRRLVLSQHPDVGGSNEAMAQINQAYRVLRDPKRREEYDRL